MPVVPSARISKKVAHSPQLKPSARLERVKLGLVACDVARRPMRASASCCTVMKSVVKYDAVSAQTVSLNGSWLAKNASERL